MSKAITSWPTLHEITLLIVAVQRSESKLSRYIQEDYERNGRNYLDTLDFAGVLGLVHVQDGVVNLAPLAIKINTGNLQEVRDKLRQLTLNATTSEIGKFLGHFEPKKRFVAYSPTLTARLSEKGIRNFLIELRLLSFDSSTWEYRISLDDYIAFLNSNEGSSSLSPRQLERIKKAQAKIGLEAELCVMAYEKQRMAGAPELAETIRHVALKDTTAGYDISSYHDELTPKKIFIEVKAVSATDFQFYLSSNELRQASILGEDYCLYLVPISNGLPDITTMRIIWNPSKNVMEGTEWKVEPDGYEIKLAN